MFLVRHAGSWGLPMSHIRHYLSVLAAGMEDQEGGEQLCYAFSSGDGVAPPGGKRRLGEGEGDQPPGSVMELDPRTLMMMEGFVCLIPGSPRRW